MLMEYLKSKLFNEFQFSVVAPERNGRDIKYYSCRNCKNMADQSTVIQSENGEYYCSMECEEQSVIQDVFEVNARYNLTATENYFE